MKWSVVLCMLLISILACIFELPGQNIYRGKKDKLPDNRFRFGFIGGSLVSQIDGDYDVGFNKWGWYAGLKGEAIINQNMSIETNLAFNEMGSQFAPWRVEDPTDSRPDRQINLRYIEIPILYKVRFPLGRIRGGFEVGVSLMTLYGSSVREDEISRKYLIFTELQDDFRTTNQSIILGGEFQYQRFSISLRVNNPLKYFYVNESFTNLYDYTNGRYSVEKMRAYYISLLGAYTLFGDFSDR